MSIATLLENAQINMEIDDLVKGIEHSTQSYPERSVQYAKFLLPLFINPFASIRTSAYQSAISIISEQPEASSQIVTAYLSALIGPDRLVARHAISFLPQMVIVCRKDAEMLIRAAIGGGVNKYGPEFQKHIKKAGDAMRTASAHA